MTAMGRAVTIEFNLSLDSSAHMHFVPDPVPDIGSRNAVK